MKTENALKKIRTFFRQNRRLPSYQEIADLMGFASKNAAFKVAQKLIEAGYLEKDQTGRLITRRLFAPHPSTGLVKAGWPSPAEEELVDLMSLDEFLIQRPEATVMVRVSGDSMIDAGIQPGDIALMERGRGPKEGDVVIASVDGEWTMKYYTKKNGQVILMPANKKYQPIVPQENLEMGGVVISVIRKYH